MFGIGGFNPVSLLATAAFGPLGGIVSQLAMQVVSQFGQQLIQQLGNQMGVDQSAIDFAQGAFAGSIGDFGGGAANLNDAIEQLGGALGASPQEIGQAQRESNDQLNQLLNDIAEGQDAREARASGRAGGWLRAMAEVLGKKLDDLAHEMEDLAGAVDKNDPSTTTEFTVVSQQFSMLMNATNTAIKTIGEAMAGTARKQ